MRTPGEVTLQVDELDPAGRIAHYHLNVGDTIDQPLYFFDGQGFRSLDGLRGRSEPVE